MARLIKILFLFALPFLVHGQTPTADSKLIGPFAAYKGQTANLKIAFLQILSADAKQTLAGTGFIGKKYPAVIGHHGIWERTTSYATMASMSTGDLTKLYNTSLPSFLRYTNSVMYNKRFAAVGRTDSTSFCYFFPQVWQGYGYTYAAYTYYMIRYIKDSMSHIIDTNRIYLVGLSLGGGGVAVAMQDPDINIHLAGCFENCAGYISYSGFPGFNFKSWAEWGGVTFLAHSTNDSTTDKNPITRVGSYYSDRINDSLLKYTTRIGNLYYYRWITGGHIIWDRPYDPTVASANWPKSNNQNSNFLTPFHAVFLSYSTKGKRTIP